MELNIANHACSVHQALWLHGTRSFAPKLLKCAVLKGFETTAAQVLIFTARYWQPS